MTVLSSRAPASRYVGCQVRLYPNRRQERLLERSLRAQRELWNALLEATIAHQASTGKFLDRSQREQFVKRWKRDAAVALDVPSNALYRVAREMGHAFSKWQRRRRQGKRGGFPRYRSRYARPTGIYQAAKSTHFEERKVRLLKVGWVRWRGGDLPRGRLVSGRVWRDAGGRWMLSLAYDCPLLNAPPAPVERVGVAIGRAPLAVVHDGEHSAHFPAAGEPTARWDRRMERLNGLIASTTLRCPRCAQRMSRREWMALRRQGRRNAPCGDLVANYVPSGRYERLRDRRAALHRRMRLKGRDAAHKASTAIVKGAGSVAVASVASRPHRAGTEFLRQLRYKTDWHGRVLELAPHREGADQERLAVELYHGGEDRPPGA